MLSWGSGAAFGSDLSAPNWISWEPEVTAFALGYNDAVVIFKTQPQVAPVTSLSIKVISVLIQCHQLAYWKPLLFHSQPQPSSFYSDSLRMSGLLTMELGIQTFLIRTKTVYLRDLGMRFAHYRRFSLFT